ncbi:MAG: c-type cytochrome [Bradyrhizobium sp.]|nr:c-type cytochrome [Bradyrhizobium sp.]
MPRERGFDDRKRASSAGSMLKRWRAPSPQSNRPRDTWFLRAARSRNRPFREVLSPRSEQGATPVRPASFAFTHLVVSWMITIALGSGSAFAAGDGAHGAAIFARQCALCHTIGKDEPNRFGPNLFGITERKAGTAPGYQYSPEFITMAIWTWSPDAIASFVVAPALTIPGNRMSVFPGVADADIDDLIAYLAVQQ